jgi:hypothetical protein
MDGLEIKVRDNMISIILPYGISAKMTHRRAGNGGGVDPLDPREDIQLQLVTQEFGHGLVG